MISNLPLSQLHLARHPRNLTLYLRGGSASEHEHPLTESSSGVFPLFLCCPYAILHLGLPRSLLFCNLVLLPGTHLAPSMHGQGWVLLQGLSLVSLREAVTSVGLLPLPLKALVHIILKWNSSACQGFNVSSRCL